MYDWICVKDRMPEPCVDVLVYYEYGLIDTGWRFYDGTFCFDGTLDYGNVTHWMPLPEPPEAEAAKEGDRDG